MNLMRSLFLKASESAWLRERAGRYPFMRRSVERFMPGERLEDALTAAQRLNESDVFAVLTHLGENVKARSEAEEVVGGYVQAIQEIRAANLSAEISVKLTQLGLDLDLDFCCENLMRIIEHSAPDRTVWIDMEHSPYVDATLNIYRRVHDAHRNTGVCLQAYLFRTEKDLASLIARGAAVRLVKGAYNEPPEIAFAEKKDVDENFCRLARMLLAPEARATSVRAALATHDIALIKELSTWAAAQGIPKNQIEFQMLYGIKRAEQVRLAHEGYRSGVLVSYGSYWFPWFMRRIAERPANAFFVARNLFGA
ncbi:MAG TPA: proline dehydrogenase family protein [Candidatus Acidoferrales bacterium]|nr:proline dehydrogenase family protein [Candidatus Acidoferrales bacterium]